MERRRKTIRETREVNSEGSIGEKKGRNLGRERERKMG